MPQLIVLASSSPYRRDLLRKLLPHFATAAPAIDESAHPGETPPALAMRLAAEKARAAAADHPNALIIGSDQVAALGAGRLGKPGHRDGAIAQLTACSGQQVTFFTGLCLLDAASGEAETLVDPTIARFRQLTRQQVERYVDRDQPFDCAGAFKAEGLGIALFERLEGSDPNSLIGLPLIALCGMLRRRGIEPLLL